MRGTPLDFAALVWGSPEWRLPLIGVAAIALFAIVLSYRRSAPPSGSGQPPRTGRRLLMAGLKAAALLALLLSLLEPMIVRTRARPAANRLVVLADTSRSMKVRDTGAAEDRAGSVRRALVPQSAWLVRAGQDFEIARYAFDDELRSLSDFESLDFTGSETRLASALIRLQRRFAREPVAGVLLFTDGNATDEFDESFAVSDLPPIFPVMIGEETAVRDLALEALGVSESAFEETPITLSARVRCQGCEGETLSVELRDERGVSVMKQTGTAAANGECTEFRFQVPSQGPGLHFLEAHTALENDPQNAIEAIDDNNRRHAVVDRQAGPYRILYLSGRPNWEYKFLRRALAEDPQTELVGLIRIAKRQPKFTFRPAGEDRRNTLFEGFEAREEEIETYDEPVILRLGTKDEFELREGFPKRAEDLFGYCALVLDDLEATFFDADQMALIEQFVGRRGGGFMMLGGEESFAAQTFDRTPLADLLPVYLETDRSARPLDDYRLLLTREGWLEPWVRLRSNESDENERRGTMPKLRTLNHVGDAKPGASVLMEAQTDDGRRLPALVTQRFGRGRSAALLCGDLWRWDMSRADPLESDLGRAWRQTLRWLVSDVPSRLELQVQPDAKSRKVTLRARLKDERFEAIDQAKLQLRITPPGESEFELEARPSATEAGTWEATFTPRLPGPYRASVAATLADGSSLPTRERGWVAEPQADELRTLVPNRARLQELARRSGGEVLTLDALDALVEDLVHRDVPVQDRELDPLWHRWWGFLVAIGCLCAEWGLRRKAGWA